MHGLGVQESGVGGVRVWRLRRPRGVGGEMGACLCTSETQLLFGNCVKMRQGLVGGVCLQQSEVRLWGRVGGVDEGGGGQLLGQYSLISHLTVPGGG